MYCLQIQGVSLIILKLNQNKSVKKAHLANLSEPSVSKKKASLAPIYYCSLFRYYSDRTDQIRVATHIQLFSGEKFVYVGVAASSQ